MKKISAYLISLLSNSLSRANTFYLMTWKHLMMSILRKLHYLDEVDTLDEVEIEEDVDTELEVDTLTGKKRQ